MKIAINDDDKSIIFRTILWIIVSLALTFLFAIIFEILSDNRIYIKFGYKYVIDNHKAFTALGGLIGLFLSGILCYFLIWKKIFNKNRPLPYSLTIFAIGYGLYGFLMGMFVSDLFKLQRFNTFGLRFDSDVNLVYGYIFGIVFFVMTGIIFLKANTIKQI